MHSKWIDRRWTHRGIRTKKFSALCFTEQLGNWSWHLSKPKISMPQDVLLRSCVSVQRSSSQIFFLSNLLGKHSKCLLLLQKKQSHKSSPKNKFIRWQKLQELLPFPWHVRVSFQEGSSWRYHHRMTLNRYQIGLDLRCRSNDRMTLHKCVSYILTLHVIWYLPRIWCFICQPSWLGFSPFREM